ncbi:MAG: hypothetical protein BWZ02_02520 [Lentisphaerae bacterium ADurb.BinA184]|nr:MAG: hypothetical protein BWZ02_02520 [Lentisphaerae bacterium ADurb.BinA184]
MCAAKYGQFRYGAWKRDDLGMPVLELDLAACREAPPACVHTLSTGRLLAAIDPLGRLGLRQLGTDSPGVLATHEAGPGFCLVLRHEDRSYTLLPCCRGDAEPPWMQWTVGSVAYGGTATLPQAALRFRVEILAPWQAEYLLVSWALVNPGDTPIEGAAIAAANLAGAARPAATPRNTFLSDGIAMFTDVAPGLGDAFLSGTPDWKPKACLDALTLERPLSLAAAATLTGTFLVGCRTDTTADWLATQLKAAQPDKVRADWAERLALKGRRFPEPWMAEECLWDNSRLYAGCTVRRPHPTAGRDPAASAAPPTVTTLPAAETDRVTRLRDLCQVALALTPIAPTLALGNLHAALAEQTPCGRLALTPDATTPPGFEPAHHPADLEIMTVLAWGHYLVTTGDAEARRQPCRAKDGSVRPVCDRLCAAATWAMREVSTGARGLMRCGAGDGNPLLDRAGRQGRGESFVTTAQVVCAMAFLDEAFEADADLARRDDLQALRRWRRELMQALEAAFDTAWFRRGYSDAGQPIGGAAEGRVFMDAQAWALLARAGTAQQREQAIAAVLGAADAAPCPAGLSLPYPLPPPAGITSLYALAGEGPNGGVSPFDWACLLWGMTEAGARKQALEEWPRLTFRRLAADFNLPPHGPTDRWGMLATSLLPHRAGAADVSPYPGPLSRLDLFAWPWFSLSKILA